MRQLLQQLSSKDVVSHRISFLILEQTDKKSSELRVPIENLCAVARAH